MILLTHGHFDHIGAVADLQAATGCDVYIHTDDYVKLKDTKSALSGYFGVGGGEQAAGLHTPNYTWNDQVTRSALKLLAALAGQYACPIKSVAQST